MTILACPVCAHPNPGTIDPGEIFRCPECGHLFSVLEPKINLSGEASISADIDVKSALDDLRRNTFQQALDMYRENRTLAGGKHLDIGCSVGQFVELSGHHGFACAGVEPEQAFADIARAKGLEIYQGYFPDAVPEGKKYSLISLMDVIGHIPDAKGVARAALERLEPDGALMIKTPVADGIFFRIGSTLHALGANALWHRLWQKDFASPQIHFFTPASMDRLATEIGGKVVARRRFAALRWKGLWQRMAPGKLTPYWKALPIYCVLSLVLPILSLFPQDSELVLIEAIPGEAGNA